MYKYLPAPIHAPLALEGAVAIERWPDNFVVMDNSLDNNTSDLRYNRIETNHLYHLPHESVGLILDFKEKTPQEILSMLSERQMLDENKTHLLEHHNPLWDNLNAQIELGNYTEVMDVLGYLLKDECLIDIDAITFPNAALVTSQSFLSFAEKMPAPIVENFKDLLPGVNEDRLPDAAHKTLKTIFAAGGRARPEDYASFENTLLKAMPDPNLYNTLYRGIRVSIERLNEIGLDGLVGEHIQSWSRSLRTARFFADTDDPDYVGVILKCNMRPDDVYLDTTPLYLTNDDSPSPDGAWQKVCNSWEWEVLGHPENVEILSVVGSPSNLQKLHDHNQLRLATDSAPLLFGKELLS